MVIKGFILKYCQKDEIEKDLCFISSNLDFDNEMNRILKLYEFGNNDIKKIIDDNGGLDSWNLTILDEIEIEYIDSIDASKLLLRYELKILEMDYIALIKPKLNYILDSYLSKIRNSTKTAVSIQKYKEKNRAQINEKNREKIKCCCGTEITRINLATHKKSIKHKKIMYDMDKSNQEPKLNPFLP